MARVGTPNLGLGCWVQGEAPGAGSQSVDNTGLNGNWIKLDTAVGTEHTSAGAHAANIIDGPNLKTTAADGVTVVLAGSPLKLSVPAGGIGATQLATAAVTAGKIATGGVSTSAQIADGIITSTKFAAGAITGPALADGVVTAGKIAAGGVSAAEQLADGIVTSLKLANATVTEITIHDDAVTPVKICHDNNRTKVCFLLGVETTTPGSVVNWKIADASMPSYLGIPMPRAGSITKIKLVDSDGNFYTVTAAYGTYTFIENDLLLLTTSGATNYQRTGLYKNGALIVWDGPVGTRTGPHAGVIEVEFDD